MRSTEVTSPASPKWFLKLSAVVLKLTLPTKTRRHRERKLGAVSLGAWPAAGASAKPTPEVDEVAGNAFGSAGRGVALSTA